MLYLSENGKVRRAEDADLAEEIVDIRNDKGPWAVIDKLVYAWTKRTPEEVQALKISIDDHREMLYDKKYGQTLGGKDFERRFTLIFPMSLQLLIRTQYKANELPFDRKFYREFAKRYPSFKVSEEV